MSDAINPFEQAVNMSGSTPGPFANTIPDPFGYMPPPTETEPRIALGNQQTAPNPFETQEEETTTAARGTAETAIPIIGPGNGLSSESLFAGPEQSDTPAKKTSGEQLNMLAPYTVAAVEGQGDAGQQSIFAKPPIFEHGAVKEPIGDLEQTFDDLRVAKSDDFPELEDAARVSWDVSYGKARKNVQTPKKTKIGEFKKSIETSKEFVDALKKDANKSPDCIIKPRITAQSKGDELALSPYKGVFTNLEDAEASGKPISIVPGSDGKVYEIRREESGTYITPSGKCGELSDIEAGFVPALPLVPRERLLEILGFFRALMLDGHNYEAIANIYWDRERKAFITSVPKQRVTATRADSELGGGYGPERYIHYMDVHSHNVMPAAFSLQDDRDEKATRLYAVLGRLNRYLPEMSLRLSNGGKYLAIDPWLVFESLDGFYPASWHCHIETIAGGGDPGRADKRYGFLDVMCA